MEKRKLSWFYYPIPLLTEEEWKRTKGEKWVKQKAIQSPRELPSVNGIKP